jgi:TRAP-type C4-dicarboxylate transport system substrate-binding protein
VFNNWFFPPDIAPISGTFEAWAKEFEEMTGGKYAIEMVHGGALAALPDAFDAIDSGLADLGTFVPQDTNVPFPMQRVFTLPWAKASCTEGTLALYDVYNQGYLDPDYDDTKVKLIFMFSSSSQDDLLTSRPVNGIADMKGLTVAMGGGIRIDIFKDLGAAPVFCPPPDVSSMLEKGIVEGSFYSAYGIYQTHEEEYLFYLIDPMRLFRVSMMAGINKDVYNNLTDDAKKAIEDLETKYTMECAAVMDRDYDAVMDQYLGPGGEGTLCDWPAEDIATLDEICAKYFQETLADTDAMGLPASEMAAAYYNALLAAGVENPAHGYTP